MIDSSPRCWLALLIAGSVLPPAMVEAEVSAPEPFGSTPSQRQMRWHRIEFYGFIHFGINTFTGKDWGYGDQPAAKFQPTDFSPRQIARVAKMAGMKGLVLTAKHHDGFCLWPSKYTDYDVASSPWRGARAMWSKRWSERVVSTG